MSPAVFQPPRTLLLVAAVVALCATPVAFGAPFLWLVYLLPVAVVVWTLRTRTVVDAEAVASARACLLRLQESWHTPSDAAAAGRSRGAS